MLVTAAEFEQMTDTELIRVSIIWDQAEYNPLTVQEREHNFQGAANEMAARFGEGSIDELASYFTASHASPADMLRMANEEGSLLVEIAKGTHTCVPRSRFMVACRCGSLEF